MSARYLLPLRRSKQHMPPNNQYRKTVTVDDVAYFSQTHDQLWFILVTHTLKQCFWTRILQNPIVPKIIVGGSWNAAKNSKYLNIVEIFTWQLATLEKSPCATNCLLSLYSFSKAGVPPWKKIWEKQVKRNKIMQVNICVQNFCEHLPKNHNPKSKTTKIWKLFFILVFCLPQSDAITYKWEDLHWGWCTYRMNWKLILYSEEWPS